MHFQPGAWGWGRVCGKIDAAGCQGAADWLARHHWWSHRAGPLGAFLEDQGPCLIKKQRHYLADKGPYSQSYFSSGHVWMWELDNKESWVPSNWCFWTAVLEKTLESPLDCKEIQPVHPKGNQSWIFIGRTDADAETPILWPPDAKNWLIGKDPDAGKDWRQEEKGMTEDEMVRWHHWLSGHEFEKAPGVGDGQGGLVCCSPSSRKESDMTKWFNWTEDPAENPSESYKGLTAFPERSQEGTGRCCPKVNSQRQEFFSVFWNQCDETEFFDETRWTWIWANSERLWRREELGMLQSMGSQRVRHDWTTGSRVVWGPSDSVTMKGELIIVPGTQ